MRRPLAPSTSLTAVSAATTPSSPGLNSATSRLIVGGAEFRPERRRSLITNRRAPRLRCMTWRTGRSIQLVVAAALLAAGCGATGASTSSRSSSSVPTVSSAPIPPSECGAANRCLALVTLRGSTQIVVRDVSDMGSPTTIKAFQHDWPQFVNGTSLSYVVDGKSLFRTPLTGDPNALVAKTSEQFATYVWSPDGATLAYLAPNSTGLELHLVRGGQDQLVKGPIPALPAVGCEIEPCPGADTWDFRLSYSRDGAFISLVMSIAGAA